MARYSDACDERLSRRRSAAARSWLDGPSSVYSSLPPAPADKRGPHATNLLENYHVSSPMFVMNYEI